MAQINSDPEIEFNFRRQNTDQHILENADNEDPAQPQYIARRLSRSPFRIARHVVRDPSPDSASDSERETIRPFRSRNRNDRRLNRSPMRQERLRYDPQQPGMQGYARNFNDNRNVHGFDDNRLQPARFQPVAIPNMSVPNLKPEPYSGSEPWEEYHSHFEDCAELCRWDAQSKVLFLSASLRGQARTFYMSLDPYERRSYDLLVFKMRQRFGSSLHASKWLNQLEARQRKPGENMAALCDDLRQLSKKAYVQLDSQAQEAIALNQLYKIIPLEMKCRCVDNDCRSLHEAAAVVDRYEAILGDSSSRTYARGNNVRAIDTSGVDDSVSGILHKLDSRLEKLESIALVQNKPPVPGQRQNERRCYSCNSLDHLYKQCPVRNNPDRRNNFSQGRRQGNYQPFYNGHGQAYNGRGQLYDGRGPQSNEGPGQQPSMGNGQSDQGNGNRSAQ